MLCVFVVSEPLKNILAKRRAKKKVWYFKKKNEFGKETLLSVPQLSAR